MAATAQNTRQSVGAVGSARSDAIDAPADSDADRAGAGASALVSMSIGCISIGPPRSAKMQAHRDGFGPGEQVCGGGGP
jgi:hypothetical protein